MSIPATTASLLEWARWYASQGHPVFPCHTPLSKGCSCHTHNCPDIGKHPRITHWQTEASTDAQSIEKWWNTWPNANIGLATGHTLFIVDIDPRKGGDISFATWEHDYGVFPNTPRSFTGGGGFHLAFAIPPGIEIRNKVDIAPGVDIRGTGGFVIVPGSWHASGQQYAWDIESDLEDVPLAQAPKWLLDLCHTPYAAPLSPDAIIPDGQRNNTLSRMAFAMRKAGMSLKGLYAGIEAENGRCAAPLDQEELKLIVKGKEHIGPDPVLKTRQRQSPDSAPAWPEPTPWEDMYGKTYPARRWLVKGLIPDGMTIIGGAPKVAKSYMAYDLALATVGQGLAFRHFGCEPGGALYCAIEDDERDSKARVLEIRSQMPSHAALYFVNTTAVPSFTQGLCDYVRSMVTKYQLGLVVIDPLMYVYDVPTNSRDPFREVKDALLPFRQMAIELQFSLVFVDHRRKESKDDVDIFETLYGSRAKTAIADSLIMLERHENEVTMWCKGRAIKQQKLHFTFEFTENPITANWTFVGQGDTYASGALQKKILQAFAESEQKGNRAMMVKDVLDYADMLHTMSNINSVRQTMFKMYKKGILLRTDTGFFTRAHDDDDRGVAV